MMKKLTSLSVLVFFSSLLIGQTYDRWQQYIEYDMNIDFDVNTHRYAGDQNIKYKNNSPDTLNRLFFHLYFNAFQPGSMMDERSRSIPDPDRRVGDRISKLSKDEIGYQRIKELKVDGKRVGFKESGTILEVTLKEPILPNKEVEIDMKWTSQVPIQIRRSGRDNAEGISYSMTQWYPKLCEYDYQGWHSNPYIGREFHGVWGKFNVTVSIDPSYVLAGTGTLTNAKDIGYDKGELNAIRAPKRVWKFEAKDVHDFAWAADPDYNHLIHKTESGVTLHMLYQDGELASENWPELGKIMEEALSFLDKNFGKYPYPQYSFVQGGDGGMEYPMLTLITGERNLSSLVGVSVHELVHSWYQMVLATNESLYPWMDEGFTSYVSAHCMNHLREQKLIPGEVKEDPMLNSTVGFANFVMTGLEEPLSTHSDHYMTNRAYGVGSYTKGSIFLNQLKYVIGEEAFNKGMLRYYNEWKFKHPNPNDFIRVMEKQSGIELDWYKEYMVNTTHYIDYAIDTLLTDDRRNSQIVLSRQGTMPMPVDVSIKLKSGVEILHTIPLRIMRGQKRFEPSYGDYRVESDWPWTNYQYVFNIRQRPFEIESITIDPHTRTVDVNPDNNVWPRPEELLEELEDSRGEEK